MNDPSGRQAIERQRFQLDPVHAAAIARLSRLESSPDAQVAEATRLLATVDQPNVVEAALHVLSLAAAPAARPMLLSKYAWFDADGIRRDPGGFSRCRVVEALRKIERRDDATVFVRATETYEFSLYDHMEVTETLRATGIVALSEAEPELAAYHATRLLVGPYISDKSGEPAVTAARVLGALGHTLPLYQCTLHPEATESEVIAACLKNLLRLPPSLVPSLIEYYRGSDDDVVLAGIFDLLLAREQRADVSTFVLDFLRDTQNVPLYRYVVSLTMSNWREAIVDRLHEHVAAVPDQTKREALKEALSIRQGHPKVDALLAALKKRPLSPRGQAEHTHAWAGPGIVKGRGIR